MSQLPLTASGSGLASAPKPSSSSSADTGCKANVVSAAICLAELSTGKERLQPVEQHAHAFAEQIKTAWPEPPRFLPEPGSRDAILASISQEETVLEQIAETFRRASEQARANLELRRILAQSTANRLSEDLWVQVFRMVVDGARLQWSFTTDTTIISISRTCALWRRITLKTPSLWHTPLYLGMITRAQALLFVKNSKDLPLRIHLQPGFEDIGGFPSGWTNDNSSWCCLHDSPKLRSMLSRYRFCELVLPRIESLDITIPRSGKPNPSKAMKSWLAPRLKTIRVGNTLPEALVLNGLCRNGMPELEVVTLDQVFVAWSALASATTLTTLHMRFTNRPCKNEDSGHSKPTEDLDTKILDVFRFCRKLKDVSLTCHDRLRLDSGKLNDRDVGIPLLHLKSLHLELTCPDIGFLLRSLVLPKDMETVKVVAVVSSRTVKGEMDNCLPGGPRALAPLCNVQSCEIRTMDGDDLDRKRKKGRALDKVSPSEWHGIRGSMEETTQDGTPFPLSFQLPQDVGDHKLQVKFVKSLSHVISADYHMPNLTELTLSDMDDSGRTQLAVKDIINFLRHCPELQSLYIYGQHAELVQQLALWHAHPVTPCCPSLGYVQLGQMSIELSVVEQFLRTFFQQPGYNVPHYRLGGGEGVEDLDSLDGRDRLSKRLFTWVGSSDREFWILSTVTVWERKKERYYPVYVLGDETAA
ncbi:hypothetical protein BXZ70DRAFT_938601 [Cristinia sonorae]|uniref:F-box domain-containing protein n=1 Tax=Cristinia sonorae TaxID=1940300 RepID=A0A8K0UQ11_9AGAR|nr:hypothetical protein BXZ70DRAFT_938601 [Cristinia sonorae]